MKRLVKILKIGGFVLLGFFILLVAGAAYLLFKLNGAVYREYTANKPSVVQYYDEPAPKGHPPSAHKQALDDRFDPGQFQHPGKEFGPWTRWWWPGNDVDKEELKREIRLFAEQMFSGVEIQPFTMGLDPKAPAEESRRVYTPTEPQLNHN